MVEAIRDLANPPTSIAKSYLLGLTGDLHIRFAPPKTRGGRFVCGLYFCAKLLCIQYALKRLKRLLEIYPFWISTQESTDSGRGAFFYIYGWLWIRQASECHQVFRPDKLRYAAQREIIFKFQFAGPESIAAIISTGQIIVFQIYLADSYLEYEGYRVKLGWETCELPYSISLEAPVPIIPEEQNLQSASYVRQ